MSLVAESYRFATTDKEKTGSPQGERQTSKIVFPPRLPDISSLSFHWQRGNLPQVCVSVTETPHTHVPINMSTDSNIAMLGFDFATEPFVTAPQGCDSNSCVRE